MSESRPSEIDIDELAAYVELRIKRSEELLSDGKCDFEKGRQMRLTGIDI